MPRVFLFEGGRRFGLVALTATMLACGGTSAERSHAEPQSSQAHAESSAQVTEPASTTPTPAEAMLLGQPAAGYLVLLDAPGHAFVVLGEADAIDQDAAHPDPTPLGNREVVLEPAAPLSPPVALRGVQAEGICALSLTGTLRARVFARDAQGAAQPVGAVYLAEATSDCAFHDEGAEGIVALPGAGAEITPVPLPEVEHVSGRPLRRQLRQLLPGRPAPELAAIFEIAPFNASVIQAWGQGDEDGCAPLSVYIVGADHTPRVFEGIVAAEFSLAGQSYVILHELSGDAGLPPVRTRIVPVDGGEPLFERDWVLSWFSSPSC